ncbi:MAG: hypothetical protein KGL39_13970 [Patescibacteria group bacterium]|nr:hypothetical protein [Patescibacteria group bacterium]
MTKPQDTLERVHITKTGRKINIRDMEDGHLLNTIRLFKGKTKSGITVIVGEVNADCEERWGEVDVLIGREAAEALHLPDYIQEAKRRGLKP